MQLVVMSSMLRTPRGNTMLGMALSRRLWLQSIASSSAIAWTLDANAKEHCYTESFYYCVCFRCPKFISAQATRQKKCSLIKKDGSVVKNKKCKRSTVLPCLVTLLWVWFYNRDKNLQWVKDIFCAPNIWGPSLTEIPSLLKSKTSILVGNLSPGYGRWNG